jgi:hypothetical protein
MQASLYQTVLMLLLLGQIHCQQAQLLLSIKLHAGTNAGQALTVGAGSVLAPAAVAIGEVRANELFTVQHSKVTILGQVQTLSQVLSITMAIHQHIMLLRLSTVQVQLV